MGKNLFGKKSVWENPAWGIFNWENPVWEKP